MHAGETMHCQPCYNIGQDHGLEQNMETSSCFHEQLEHLCSEILPHDYPYWWFTSDPKSKQDKVKVTNF